MKTFETICLPLLIATGAIVSGRCELAQFFINQRQQCLGGGGIALLNCLNDAREVAHDPILFYAERKD